MRLVKKDTGEQVDASAAGAEVLLARGTHELIEEPKPKATRSHAKKEPAEAGE